MKLYKFGECQNPIKVDYLFSETVPIPFSVYYA